MQIRLTIKNRPALILAMSALAISLLWPVESIAGSAARSYYDGVSGTGVDALTNAAIFPGNPTFREQLDDFTLDPGGLPLFGLQGKENSGTDYGSWVRGYLEAPTNGTYIFFIASDDSSELWLSTNHLESGSVRIAYETGSGAPLFNGVRLTERRSPPISLVRAQKYYFEVRHKQGSGASYLQVGWQRPDGVQEIIPALHLAQHPVDAYLSRTTANLPPEFNTDGFNAGDLPAATNVNELEPLLLQLDVIAAQPASFQWLSNGIPIPGEDLSFLRWQNVPLSANGVTIQAVVSNAFGVLHSTSTHLTVTAVATPLRVTAVDHRGNPNGLVVTFSKQVNPVSATNLANYALTPEPGGAALSITNAKLLADGASVQLRGAFNFVESAQYRVSVQNVEDQAASPNPLDPNPAEIQWTFSGPHLGPVGFASNNPLKDLAVLENRLASFEVLLTGAQPWSYQWFHEGQALSGATNSTLNLRATTAAAGSYHVVVSNEFSSTVSPVVTLDTIPDLVPPVLAGIRGLASGLNLVELTFDEALDPVLATNPASYSLGLVPVYSATLNEDGTVVTLQTGGLVEGQLYLLTISGVKDTAAAGNAFTGTAAFVAAVNYVGEVLRDGAVRYWRLDETNGTRNLGSLASAREAITSAVASPVNNPKLRVPGLLLAEPGSTGVEFRAANAQHISVPNGNDINTSAGPWAKKSVELWFRAGSLPAPGSTGLAATAALWEQGGANRDLALYLWRDPANLNSNEAALVFHVLNNLADGAGSPFGPPASDAVFVQTNIVAGKTYHVVAVLDGDSAGTNGSLILYVNGVEVARAQGAGQIYNHIGNVRLGFGNGRIHTGESGDLGYFDGTVDEVALYNRALPPTRVQAHYRAGEGIDTAPGVSQVRVDTRGNPNLLMVTFPASVSELTATDLSNYTLRNKTGSVLSLGTAELLADNRTVLFRSGFTLQSGSEYSLSVSNIVLQGSEGSIELPPAVVTFSFVAPTPLHYGFDEPVSSAYQLFGNASLVEGGSYDNSGYLRLTDATVNQNGAILFSDRRDVSEFQISFKVRISDTSSNAADGFSVNLAADLPTATLGVAEEGYQPLATITADRLVVAFDNYASNSGDSSPSIALKWRGVVLTNVLTGTNGIPSLHNPNGAWVDVDLKLDRGNTFTAVYAGVPIIHYTLPDFNVIHSARLGFAARTGGSYQTHWFDDIRFNFEPGNLGPVGIGAGSELENITAAENQIVRFSIVPTGVGPFAYQWYRDDTALPAATNRVLFISAASDSTGHYHAVLRNEFSQVTSPQAVLTVDSDRSPPAVLRVLGLAGTLNEVRIWFDEPLDISTAGDLARYSAGTLSLSSVTVSPDGKLVTLSTGPQAAQGSYTVHLDGLRDRSVSGNSLVTTLPFVSEASYVDEVLADHPVRYWRFDETIGVNAHSLISELDNLATTLATLVNGPLLGQPALVPNASGNGATRLTAANSQRITIPNGSDINIGAGPWEKKTVEFWFKATGVPAPGSTGTAATAGLYEQGAGTRGLSIYLWRNPANANPNEADLVFTAWNNTANDGPGSPFGVPGTPVFVSVPVTAGQTYHVTAVFDGGTNLATGQLILYLNGLEVSRASGAGRLYIHTADVQIGRGNTLLHTSANTTAVNLPYFDGYIDEVALYNTALAPDRAEAHFRVAGTVAATPRISSFHLEGGAPVIRWDGAARLQVADDPTGPFQDVPGATSPYAITPNAPAAFFRLTR